LRKNARDLVAGDAADPMPRLLRSQRFFVMDFRKRSESKADS
jgi:hypothetical protein